MSVALREKLKKAKKNSELKRIKEMIASETNMEVEKIKKNDINYQNVIDFSYQRIILDKHVCDISKEEPNFFNFAMGFSKNDLLTFYVATEENIFFITVPADVVQKHYHFFWSNGKLFQHTNDRIFISENMLKGFVVLISEYGIEKAAW